MNYIKLRILLIIIIISILVAYFISSNKSNARICADYYDIPCSWYSSKTNECYCGGERLLLTQEEVVLKNEFTKGNVTKMVFPSFNSSGIFKNRE